MTLREVWELRGLSPTQLAAQANISTTTLYKMNKGEKVSNRSIIAVCQALGITRDQYDILDPEKPSL